MRFVDAHVHLLPGKFMDRMKVWIRKRLGVEIPIKMNAEEVYTALKGKGARFIFNLTHSIEPGHTFELNKWQKTLKEEHADIYTFGAFHPLNEVKDLPGIFEKYRLDGLKLHPGVQRFYPNSNGAIRIYSVLEKINKPLIVHTGHFLDNGYKYTHPKLYKQLITDFTFPVILAHMCYEYFDYLEKYLDQRSNVYVDCSLVMIKKEIYSEVLRRNVKYYPPTNDFLERYSDKILYGSEIPIVAWDPYSPLKNLSKLEISEKAKNKILFRNAEKFIKHFIKAS